MDDFCFANLNAVKVCWYSFLLSASNIGVLSVICCTILSLIEQLSTDPLETRFKDWSCSLNPYMDLRGRRGTIYSQYHWHCNWHFVAIYVTLAGHVQGSIWETALKLQPFSSYYHVKSEIRGSHLFMRWRYGAGEVWRKTAGVFKVWPPVWYPSHSLFYLEYVFFQVKVEEQCQWVFEFLLKFDHKSFPRVGNFSYIWSHIFAWGREFYSSFSENV